MLQPERLKSITSIVDKKGFITISELMSLCRSSKSTIHRDLEELEKTRQINRIRGGAISVKNGTTYEPPLAWRRDYHTEEKQRIAVEALKFIHPRDTILLDSGTTTHELAKQLIHHNNLMVATNDIIIAYDLSFNLEIDLIVTGGLARKNYHTLIGAFGENIINQLHADKLFLSLDAVDIDHGCMCYSLEEMQIKRAMIRAAKEVILLCDHSKFETVAFVNVCQLSDVDIIITDKALDKRYAEQIKQHDIQLILV